jgi:hypothetical protein
MHRMLWADLFYSLMNFAVVLLAGFGAYMAMWFAGKFLLWAGPLVGEWLRSWIVAILEDD